MAGAHLDRLGSLPSLVVGSGPPLVFLAGLGFDSGIRPGRALLMHRRTAAPFARFRTVHYVNRWQEIEPGSTIAEIAARHAEAIAARFDSPVDLAGLSTGGSIAQQIAAGHPQLVRRLVLLSTGSRLSEPTRELQRRIAARAQRGARRQTVALMAADLVTGDVPGGPVGAIAAAGAWLAAPLLAGRRDLRSMAATIEAEDGFDLARCPPITAPTLLVAGSRDSYYPRAELERTVALIPGCRLVVIGGLGHLLAPVSPPAVAAVREFLAGTT